MLRWLATAARERRIAAGRTQLDIAHHLGRDQAVVSRFERMRFEGRTWPRNLSAILDAYAAELDCSVRDIWQDAFELSKQKGPLQ